MTAYFNQSHYLVTFPCDIIVLLFSFIFSCNRFCQYIYIFSPLCKSQHIPYFYLNKKFTFSFLYVKLYIVMGNSIIDFIFINNYFNTFSHFNTIYSRIFLSPSLLFYLLLPERQSHFFCVKFFFCSIFLLYFVVSTSIDIHQASTKEKQKKHITQQKKARYSFQLY